MYFDTDTHVFRGLCVENISLFVRYYKELLHFGFLPCTQKKKQVIKNQACFSASQCTHIISLNRQETKRSPPCHTFSVWVIFSPTLLSHKTHL